MAPLFFVALFFRRTVFLIVCFRMYKIMVFAHFVLSSGRNAHICSKWWSRRGESTIWCSRAGERTRFRMDSENMFFSEYKYCCLSRCTQLLRFFLSTHFSCKKSWFCLISRSRRGETHTFAQTASLVEARTRFGVLAQARAPFCVWIPKTMFFSE